MILIFTLIAFVTLAGAVFAMSLRNLVHCALCLMLAFGGLAEPPQQPAVTPSWVMGAGVAVLTFGSLAAAVLAGQGALANPKTDVAADVAVKRIGEKLMTDYVLPLEVVALLLTAALIGAVSIAMREEPK